MKKKATQINSVYEKISFSRQLAKGVQMIVTDMSMQAILVSQNVANRFLSFAARSRATTYKDHLVYPEEKMSIPLFELTAKNYIIQYHSQVKEHWNNLVKYIPDYLREIGILHPKVQPTIKDKVSNEFEKYYKNICRQMTKQDIILHAEEISDIKNIALQYSQIDMPLKNQGIILGMDNLLDKTYQLLSKNQLESSKDNIEKLIVETDWSLELKPEEYAAIIKNATADITRELSMTQESIVKTVLLSYNNGSETKSFSLSIQDFNSFCLTDELKAEFSAKNMLDFPQNDYFGQENEAFFEFLFQKRFGENLIENWNNFSVQSDDATLTIDGLSTEIIPTSAYDELINRYTIKEYLTTNYTNADKQLSKLLEYTSKHLAAVNSIQEMLSSQNAQGQEELTEEPLRSEAIETVNDESQHLQAELDKLIQLKALKVELSDTADLNKIEERIAKYNTKLSELHSSVTVSSDQPSVQPETSEPSNLETIMTSPDAIIGDLTPEVIIIDEVQELIAEEMEF